MLVDTAEGPIEADALEIALTTQWTPEAIITAREFRRRDSGIVVRRSVWVESLRTLAAAVQAGELN